TLPGPLQECLRGDRATALARQRFNVVTISDLRTGPACRRLPGRHVSHLDADRSSQVCSKHGLGQRVGFLGVVGPLRATKNNSHHCDSKKTARAPHTPLPFCTGMNLSASPTCEPAGRSRRARIPVVLIATSESQLICPDVLAEHGECPRWASAVWLTPGV